MTSDNAPATGHGRAARLAALIVVGVLIAIISARPYAVGWNDGSRLAAVESLVDYHTWEISRSIFIAVPERNSPYSDPAFKGSLDKMKVGDNWYSDKSPPVSLAMAGIYQALQSLTGLKAKDQPRTFCYLMTLLTSGVAYVIAVLCVFGIAGQIGLPEPQQWLVTASFGLATVAPAFARSVNSHILILAAVSGICLLIVRPRPAGATLNGRVLLLGVLAGAAYAIEQAAGPIVLACTAALVVWRHRSAALLMMYAAGAAPLVLLYHALDFQIFGVLLPGNYYAEYFLWPGSPFSRDNLTGHWLHHSPEELLRYAALVLIGTPGFLGHDLPAFLALAGIGWAWRARERRDLVVYACAVVVGTWLLGATTSNNYSGVAVTVRWFVPLLAPIYLLISSALASQPKLWSDLAVLSGVGLLLSIELWAVGPFGREPGWFYWPLQGLAAASWLALHVVERSGSRKPALTPVQIARPRD
jgi:hypothetical protein